MAANNPFYKSKRWKNKRENILRRDEYLCRECSRYGKTTQANTVHHIFPFEDYPEHKLNNNNLLSVCSRCHASFHNRLTNEMTEAGTKWMERMRDKIISE